MKNTILNYKIWNIEKRPLNYYIFLHDNASEYGAFMLSLTYLYSSYSFLYCSIHKIPAMSHTQFSKLFFCVFCCYTSMLCLFFPMIETTIYPEYSFSTSSSVIKSSVFSKTHYFSTSPPLLWLILGVNRISVCNFLSLEIKKGMLFFPSMSCLPAGWNAYMMTGNQAAILEPELEVTYRRWVGKQHGGNTLDSYPWNTILTPH